MKVDIDSLIKLIKKNVYENHRQDVTAIMVQDAVSAVARNVGVSVNQLYDNIEEHIEFITKQVVFKDEITQDLGDSSNKVMSQKAVTDNLESVSGVVNSINQYIYSLSDAALYNGHIDPSNKIVSWGQAKYVVIKIEPQDKLFLSYPAPLSAYIFVKSFVYGASLPYTLDLCSGESLHDIPSAGVTTIAPNDAHYVLIRYCYNDGTSLFPTAIEINGYNIFNSLTKNISNLSDHTQSLISNLSDHTKTLMQANNNYSDGNTYEGHLDGTNKILYYGSAKFVAIKINGGDNIFIKAAYYGGYMLVKNFTTPINLPYTPTFATEESYHEAGVDVSVNAPSDAEYLLVRYCKSDGTLVAYTDISINGYNILQPIRKNIEQNIASINTINSALAEIQKISSMQEYDGWIDSSNKIVSYGLSKYVVIPVEGKTSIRLKKRSDISEFAVNLFIVKSFRYNPTLPYIPDFADGETGRRQVVNDTTISLPNDASHILLASRNLGGEDVTPEYFYVDGYNYTESVSDQIGTINNKIEIIDEILSPNVFSQKNDLKINKIFEISGYQGMCTIDGILCSATGQGIYMKDEQDTLIGTKHKKFGIEAHNNDIDYCEYSNTLITATIQPTDAEHMQICLLQNAKEKLQSDTVLTEQDWLRITLSEFDNSYIMVGNCFGESCDIVYAVLIDKTENYRNKNKRILKIKLGYQSGVYDGTFEILRNVAFPHILEIQGSKYLNGYLFISTDSHINTDMLHSSVTVVNLETMKTTEHISYRDQSEINDSVEAEGLSFLNGKLYQIVIISPNGDHTARIRQLREFDIFHL